MMKGVRSSTALFHGGDDGLAGGHAERAADEVEVVHGDGDIDAEQLALGGDDRILEPGLGAVFLELVGIALGGAELQRIVGAPAAAAVR